MGIRTSYAVDEFDFDLIVDEIQNSYWGAGRSREGIIKSFLNSFPVGLFLKSGEQIGWARATSDTVYLAYIQDLQIQPEYRGQGLGKRLTADLMNHPELRSISGWMLATKDQHHLYRKFGFKDADPELYMALSR